MLPTFARQTITILKPATKVSRGSTVPDWDSPSELIVPGCSVQPGSTSLDQDGRILGLADGWTAYIPDGVNVQEGDRVKFDGQIFEIYGEPRRWTGIRSRSHIQLSLRRWEG